MLLLCCCGHRSKEIVVAVAVAFVVVAVRALRPVRRSHWRPSPAVRSTLWVQLWYLLLPKRRWVGSRTVLVMLLIVVVVASSTMSSLSRPTTTRSVGKRSVDDGEDGETLRRNEPFSFTTSITYDFAGDGCHRSSGGLSVYKKQNEKVNMGPIRGDCDWGHARTTANKKEDTGRTPFKNIFESGSYDCFCNILPDQQPA